MIPKIGRKNCVNCDKYFGCKDPCKSIVFVCERYRKSSESNELKLFEDAGLYVDKESPESRLPMPDPRQEFNAVDEILKAIESKKIVSPDLKLPEGDFAKAPNFYTWSTDKKFSLEKPFLEQAIMGTQLFAEWCPECTDVEWFLHDHKVTDKLSKFERKVALLEHGVCPHCKRTRKHLHKKKGLPIYIELACCCGQRSGKSAFLGMASSYLTHLQMKLERPNEVYRLLSSNVLQGTFVALTFAQAKDTLWDPFYGNLLDSPWWCIAEDTPVTLANNTSVSIQDVRVGDAVKTLEGESTVENVFDNGFQECFELTTEDGHVLPGTGRHQVRCLSPDGQSLVWKNIDDISEGDYIVTE